MSTALSFLVSLDGFEGRGGGVEAQMIARLWLVVLLFSLVFCFFVVLRFSPNRMNHSTPCIPYYTIRHQFVPYHTIP